MTPAMLAAASLLAAYLLVALPLPFAFALFFGSLILVPDTMRFPYGPSNELLLVRLLPVVFLIGLLVRSRRGELPSGAFRPSGAHIGIIAFAAVAWVLGVTGVGGQIPPA